MSEAFLTVAFLSLSGGLQDAYTYILRGHVFANAQTGNIVLLAQAVMNREPERIFSYLMPLAFFAAGIAAAEWVRLRESRLHWRQWVLLAEILILFSVGFMPETINPLANGLVSFSCAMQVQAFRKILGLRSNTGNAQHHKGHQQACAPILPAQGAAHGAKGNAAHRQILPGHGKHRAACFLAVGFQPHNAHQPPRCGRHQQQHKNGVGGIIVAEFKSIAVAKGCPRKADGIIVDIQLQDPAKVGHNAVYDCGRAGCSLCSVALVFYI